MEDKKILRAESIRQFTLFQETLALYGHASDEFHNIGEENTAKQKAINLLEEAAYTAVVAICDVYCAARLAEVITGELILKKDLLKDTR